MRYLIKALCFIMLACCCNAQGKGKAGAEPSTNAAPAKVQKPQEKKLEHALNKLTVKTRDKGSKKESDFKPEKEFTLMFGNNKLAKKPKQK